MRKACPVLLAAAPLLVGGGVVMFIPCSSAISEAQAVKSPFLFLLSSFRPALWSSAIARSRSRSNSSYFLLFRCSGGGLATPLRPGFRPWSMWGSSPLVGFVECWVFGVNSGELWEQSKSGSGWVWFGFVWVVWSSICSDFLEVKGPMRIAGVMGVSPELVPVAYCYCSIVYCTSTGVGSSCDVFSVFLSTEVGFGWFICMLSFSTGVGSGLLLSFATGVGHVEIAIHWVRSSRFTGHCSSLGSHPPPVQSSVLPWPCQYQHFCEVGGCERHLFRHSLVTVGPHHLTSFDLSIKIGRFIVGRSCVINWRFLDPLRSFGSRPGLWSWIPLARVIRPVSGPFL